MRIITLANQKGGVAKTTSALALSTGLAGKGYKVLAVDLDPQGNFSLSSSIDTLQVTTNLYHAFKGEIDLKSIIFHSPLGFDLVPGGLDLAGADMEFTQLGREKMLSKLLNKINGTYDYVVIDTPPTLGILTANSLIASHYLIVPMAEDIYSIQGLSQLNGFIQNVYENGNPDLKILGLLITKYNGRQNLSKILYEQIYSAAQTLGTKVFESKIRESVAVRENAVLQGDLFKEAPKAKATIDYSLFVEEVLGRMN